MAAVMPSATIQVHNAPGLAAIQDSEGFALLDRTISTSHSTCLSQTLGLSPELGIYKTARPTHDSMTASIELPVAMKSTGEKRRRDFLDGRYCAHRALRSAGYQGATELAQDQDRLPRWPDGWTGSISHCVNTAIAVAGNTSTITAIGVDVEAWMAADVAQNVGDQIAHPDELACLGRMKTEDALTVVFSAKEALYKALYPITRRFRNFDAAYARAAGIEWIDLELTLDWSVTWPKGSVLRVRYHDFGDHLVTLLHLP